LSALPSASERLEDERSRALALIDERRAQLDGLADVAVAEGRDDEHDPDGATVAFEHSLAVGLLAEAERSLAEVELAFQRLEDGAYGRCARCGRDIPTERLAVRPTALTCVGCAGPGHGVGRGSRSVPR
jgi:RNA polymerase-binding transcription factor DksA